MWVLGALRSLLGLLLCCVLGFFVFIYAMDGFFFFFVLSLGIFMCRKFFFRRYVLFSCTLCGYIVKHGVGNSMLCFMLCVVRFWLLISLRY